MGMAFGIFAGLMPIMPFQIALAIALAILFKGSKITAAIGTWVSNPLNWYFLYLYSYKLGAYILGVRGANGPLASIMASIAHGDEPLIIIKKIVGEGSLMMATFCAGGLIFALAGSIPAYFVFLRFFQRIRCAWRKRRKGGGIDGKGS